MLDITDASLICIYLIAYKDYNTSRQFKHKKNIILTKKYKSSFFQCQALNFDTERSFFIWQNIQKDQVPLPLWLIMNTRKIV